LIQFVVQRAVQEWAAKVVQEWATIKAIKAARVDMALRVE
jgi:hypothetical protein